jgi:hypothetical protein
MFLRESQSSSQGSKVQVHSSSQLFLIAYARSYCCQMGNLLNSYFSLNSDVIMVAQTPEMFYMKKGAPMRRVVIWFGLLSFLVFTLPLAATGNFTIPGPLSSGWQQGFDFRNSASFVIDPSRSTYVLSTTAYPTTVNGVTFGWVKTSLSPETSSLLTRQGAGVFFR